jgi:chemotaxis protein MotB
MEKKIVTFVLGLIVLSSCVPSKKYNELLESQRLCSEELAKYKTLAIDNEGLAKNLQTEYDIAKKDIETLKKDTAEIGEKYRLLQVEYDKSMALNQVLEGKFDQLRSTGTKQISSLQANLEEKSVEIQQKENALRKLEADLQEKDRLLQAREARVNELESMISQKDQAVQDLKNKISKALLGFEGKGLTVVEKDGKIYVSLEAKLLFASGSTTVEEEGKKALIQLSKALESNEDWEIIVEGHTDTDMLKSANHPTNNWELSVLRATSVVEIMLANSTIDPKTLVAAGRSEFHPVDAVDKAKNRRIEVIISPNLDKLFRLLNNKED